MRVSIQFLFVVPHDCQAVECSVIDYGTVFEGTFTFLPKVCHSFFVSPCLTTYVKSPTTTRKILVKAYASKLRETLSNPFKFCLKLDKSNEQHADVHFCGKFHVPKPAYYPKQKTKFFSVIRL